MEKITSLGPGTDWQDELMTTAFMTNHQLSVSGGSERTHYMVSGAYLKQDGLVVGSGFDRFTGRVNLDTEVNSYIKFGVNASFSRSTQKLTLENNYGGPGIIETAIRQLPSAPVRNPDGSFGQQQENMFGTYYPNPLEEAMERENFNRNTNFMANAWGDVRFLKDFVLRLEYGGNFSFSNSYNFTAGHDYEFYKQLSSSSRQANNGYSTDFKAYINYNKEIGRNRINAMVGHESQMNKWEYLSGGRSNFLYNTIHDLSVGDASTATNNNAQGDWALESYYGRVNYSFDNRYLFTGTLRTDGSSNFAKENRWGWFPSVALAWRIDQEAFMKRADWLTNLKLRLGWGIVGNQNAGSYAYGSDMATSPTIWGSGFYPNRYSNPDLKWERTKSYNAGFDIAALNNRIEFIFDAYLKKTDNLIMQASLPTYLTGLISSPYVNAGALENKGFEFTLNTVNISNQDFQWTTGLTFSLNRNKITSLYTETKCGPDVTERGRDIALAEARLMRGIAYLYTTCLWDNIIIFEKNQDVIREPKQPLRPGYDGLTMAIRDLTWAAEHLPEKPLATGRATKWSAEAMLAKTYLFRSGWKGGSRDQADLDKAKQYALDVCQNSGLNLLPNYDDLFHIAGNNNEESLLAMQWVENGEWGVRNTLLADIAFSSKVTGGINVWGGGNASVDMLSLYEPEDSVRLYSTFFVYGHKYPEINRADGGYVHEDYSCPIRKFIPGSMEDNGGVYMESMSFPQNTYFVRLADTYLTLAEACLGNNAEVTGGDGLVYFNKVRKRAGISQVSKYDIDDLIKERRIEFCMEYVNWYDMVSWYKWQPDKMIAYFKSQHRGQWADRYFRGEDGYMKYQYMDYDTDTYVDLDLTSTEPWPARVRVWRSTYSTPRSSFPIPRLT